ncbi:TRAP transporter small permease subunit [Pseudooceanicola sp. CBS1P-1]|uniref:TRAP transporter small permease protein n=1 Tax=Pseudooceanicola albus TaxID=2692189 RepID=A0A6L7G8D9_9RHOB|nr:MULTISPECIES: TRAP transporter small permease subunit [Pseudooceanicola]MBT9385903.1 TRAP transporter small permease subunit [Pseudooceanicola endophyticus]MXN19676.1 TRAP transporter small permease subunit [Pseudooceanicola albus]
MSDLSDHLPRPLAVPLRGLRAVMHAIIVLNGCLMALTFFCVVILRYVFHADLFAYEEWLMAAAFWGFFMAAAVATHDRAHINADILGLLITRPLWRWRRALLVEALELAILSYLSWLGWEMVMEEIADYPMWQSTIALHIPFLVPRAAIALGFVLMWLFSALHLWVLLKEGPAAPEAQA